MTLNIRTNHAASLNDDIDELTIEERRGHYNREESRAHFLHGEVEFGELDQLFRPGYLIYSKDQLDEPQLHRVWSDTDGLSASLNIEQTENEFSFIGWNMQWDVSTRQFKPTPREFKLARFQGRKIITSLPFVPLKYHIPLTRAREEFLRTIERRGDLWKNLVSGPPVSRKHSGLALVVREGVQITSLPNRVHLNDRVIIDGEGPAQYGIPEPQTLNYETHIYHQGSVFNSTEQSTMNVWHGPKMGAPKPIVGTDDVNALSPGQDFTPLQARLCPSNLTCYSPSSRTWFSASVSRLSEIKWNASAWEHLVLDSDIKDTIMTLVQQHRARSSQNVSGDVIEGKGNGLIIALHGPPGVGKTLTAESVAELTERPLYAINVGELTSEEHVRARLQAIFTDATKWNAVLLLDEADVVLEKRSFEDIRRNGTVSIFLRMLEYYQGILFLTTNRLKHIDEAFHSRIHLAYEYEDLTAEQRRTIWSNFIDQLPAEEQEGKAELRENLATLKTLNLNGRQIRNILFTARSLAQGEQGAGGLRYKHVQRMIEYTKGFQRCFSDGQERKREALGASATSGRAWGSR